MRPSEIRFLQREKHDAEHTGTAMPVSAFLNFLKKEESLSEVQVTAMKEDIRNEAAKACARSIENAFPADYIKQNFAASCDLYEKKGITHENLLKLFHEALKSLNELRYENN